MKLFEFFGVSTYENGNDKDQTLYDNKTQEDKEKLENDLYWFILDDDQLHKECFMPLAMKLKETIKSKEFDLSKHVKDWLPMVNKGCMKYYKKTQMSEDPKDVFTKDLRKSLCHRLAEQSIEDIKKGEYDLG